ncbi:unnamed protein product [Urochloa decumbens]|uniref:Uncharacterized protein n=1 Tax=Urochloa decumbens TaxID=240449 RepID=A0ABC8VZW2_9POAL
MPRNHIITAPPTAALPQPQPPALPPAAHVVACLTGIREGPLLPVGCLHGEDAHLLSDPQVMKKIGETAMARICQFYTEAISRLPIYQYPQLVNAMCLEGHCYGPLDPVSNIIFNTIHAFPTRPNFASNYGFFRPMDHQTERQQVLRYLHLTDFDLLKTVLLIERERNACARVEPFFLQGTHYCHTSRRFLTSLKFAATAAQHPRPDKVVTLATKALTATQIRDVQRYLRGPLGLSDIHGIYDSIKAHVDHNPVCDPVTSLRQAIPLRSLISNFPDPDPTTYFHQRKCSSSLDSSSCEHIRTVKMLLLDSIHGFYLEALSRIPQEILLLQHHAFIIGGYCYGPFDNPVMNILLMSLWYAACFPFEGVETVNSICNHKLRRLERHSLTGLVACLKTRFVSLSEHEALEYLYFCRCNMADAVKIATAAGHSPSMVSDAFVLRKAAKASQDPHLELLIPLLSIFSSETKNEWQRIVTSENGMVSLSAFHDLCKLSVTVKAMLPTLGLELPSPTELPELSDYIRETIRLKKEVFLSEQLFFFSKVESVLSEYKGKLISSKANLRFTFHSICGLSGNFQKAMPFYHINFIARKEVSVLPRGTSNSYDGQYLEGGHTLFFAEIWSNSAQGYKSYCCPVVACANQGRCFCCEDGLAKIIHPTSEAYVGSDDGHLVELHDYLYSHADTELKATDSDYYYYGSKIGRQFDVAFAEHLKEKTKLPGALDVNGMQCI